jgi:hypothetical protein
MPLKSRSKQNSDCHNLCTFLFFCVLVIKSHFLLMQEFKGIQFIHLFMFSVMAAGSNNLKIRTFTYTYSFLVSRPPDLQLIVVQFIPCLCSLTAGSNNLQVPNLYIYFYLVLVYQILVIRFWQYGFWQSEFWRSRFL